jgi:flagellar basal-body rod modification protein FlgD
MAVTGVSGAANPPVVAKDKIGFNGLNADTFMKLLIAQLQNQDPTQPVGNSELLQQLSTMRNLQASVELSDTLKTLTANQQVTAGASFLGKVITGTNASEQEVSGVADRVFLSGGELTIGIGNEHVSVSKVTGVKLRPGQAA